LRELGYCAAQGRASWAAGGACWVGERCVRETGGWGPVEGAVGRARPRGEKGGSWPCGRRGELAAVLGRRERKEGKMAWAGLG